MLRGAYAAAPAGGKGALLAAMAGLVRAAPAPAVARQLDAVVPLLVQVTRPSSCRSRAQPRESTSLKTLNVHKSYDSLLLDRTKQDHERCGTDLLIPCAQFSILTTR